MKMTFMPNSYVVVVVVLHIFHMEVSMHEEVDEVIDYKSEVKTDVDTFHSKEAGRSFVQDTVLQTIKEVGPLKKRGVGGGGGTRKYVIRGKSSVKGAVKKGGGGGGESSEVDALAQRATVDVNTLLVTQLQISNTQTQMGQSQLMGQLMDLKNSLLETKTELNAKLREINSKMSELDLKTSRRGGTRGSVSSTEEKLGSGSGGEAVEAEEGPDYSHLVSLKRESVGSLYTLRAIDENYIKNILKGKNPSSFMKVFDMIYNSQKYHEGDFEDIYPVRVLKGRTIQYYVDGKWLHDTGGSVVIDIIVHNIKLLFTKVNSDNYASGEYDMSDFIDNQAFLETFDEKRFKSHMLSMIKDAITNHKTNR